MADKRTDSSEVPNRLAVIGGPRICRWLGLGW